jgi:PAS domain S-box-containing protein
MSLTSNIQKILAPMALTMLAIVLGGTLLVITPAFRRVERQNTQRITSQAMFELTSQIDTLDAMAHDHALSENIYDFAIDPVENQGVADTGFSDSFFLSQGISDVFVLNNSGDIIFEKSFANETEKQAPTRERLANLLSNPQLTIFSDANDKISGILAAPEGTFIVAARLIVNSNDKEVIAGTLIMTRPFNESIISSISNSAGLPVKLYSYSDDTLPDDLKNAQQYLSAAPDSTKFYSKAIDMDTTAGYGIIYDIYGNPAMVLQVLIPRDIYHTAIVTIQAYMAFIILFHIVSIIVSIYLIRRFIISRVQKTADFTKYVSASNDLSKRLEITGNDEIAELETSLNTMIDTLKNTQEQLHINQRNEEELRRTIESVTEAISTIDMNLNIVNCNDASVSLFEYGSKQEIIGKKAMDFIAPCDRASTQEIIRQMTEQGYSGIHEINMLKGSGEKFIAEISGAIVKKTEGTPLCFVTSARDITERKNAETRLKAQYDIIERILATLPQAVMVVSEKKKVILANHAFYSIFNIHERDVKGKSLIHFLPVKELDDIISSTLVGDNASFHVDFGLEISGRKRTYSATAISMPPHETLLLFVDLTEIRERTEKLFLNDRLASIGELASGVAHELGSPLSSIIMFSELLRQQDLPQTALDDIQTIESEAHRGAEIIKNLLAFARKNSADKQKINITSILDAVLKLRSHEHKIKNITVVKNLDSNLPEVSVDFTRMEQVFLNIIINAEQAMFEAHKRGTLTITATSNKNQVKISFADDGIGISEENKKYIFDPFFTTKPVGEGTGLGLSICYGIVRQHGGNLSVSSQEGAGATFTLKLPVADTSDNPRT